MDDFILISKIKVGNQSALDSLFNKYHQSLLHFAFLQLSNKELAEEVVSDVFLKVWIKRDKIAIRSSVKAYLYAITRNTIYDYHSGKPTAFTELTDQHYQALHTIDNPEKMLLYKEMNSSINNVINELPGECRKIFLMNRNDGLKYKEIAEVLDISVRTVENQMGKALRIIRNSLAYIFHFLTFLFIHF